MVVSVCHLVGCLTKLYQNRMILSDPLEMRRRMEGITSSAFTKSAWPGVEEMSSFVYGECFSFGREVLTSVQYLCIPDFDRLCPTISTSMCSE